MNRPRGDEDARSELVRSWPVLLGLVIQALIFAYFIGGLSKQVESLSLQVRELATKESVTSIDRRVERLELAHQIPSDFSSLYGK